MSTSFPYAIVFTGETSGFRAAAQDVKNELASVKTFAIQWGQETEKVTSTGSRGMRSMIWGTQLLLMYGGFLYQNTVRQELATASLETAQDNYNKAVREYGVNSEQAINAAKMLEKQQLLVARANQMATFMTASFGLQMVATTAEFVKQIPAILTATTALWGYVTAQAAAHPWLVPAMIGGALAVGAIASNIHSQNQINIGGAQITVTSSEKDLDSALDKYNKQVKEEYKRKVGG